MAVVNEVRVPIALNVDDTDVPYADNWLGVEYPDSAPNRAGSYLYEPPGSTHTLGDHNTEATEALFVVGGALVLYNEDGTVMDVIDAATHKRDYFALLGAQGKSLPRIIEGGAVTYTDEA
jgi:2,4'-dihydroxyacetophenone dioxygenase